MKNKTYFVRAFMLAVAVLLSACDQFVEVDLPSSQLTAEAVFESTATADAAMADVYTKIRNAGLLTGLSSGMSSQLGSYTDELVYYGPAGLATENFFHNTLLANDQAILEWWNSTYSQIYAANAVYEGVGNATALTVSVKAQLQGEALFIRALLHFYLLQLYGEVPYISTTDYESNSRVSRRPIAEVYDLLETDLEAAIALLPEDYAAAERTRPNRATAQALLARVYLYQGKWAAASNEASAVLNQTALYQTENDLEQVFKISSPATIWQLATAAPGENTAEALTFIFIGGPPPRTALSGDLMMAFQEGDMRKAAWTKAVTDGSSTWYHANKYTTAANTGSSIEYSVVFRLSEQYLIRAEARAWQGDLIGSKEDLNVVRHAAALGNTEAVTKEELIAAIATERRFEFFTEHGHRFFDLKRQNALDPTLTGVKPGWDSNDALLPLPERELQVNPLLNPQNPGY